MKVITNNVPRPIIYSHDLTPKEQAEMQDLLPNYWEDESYIRYKGQVYPLSDFLQSPPHLYNWDAFRSDSFFSGLAVKLSDCGDAVTVALILS